MIDTGLVIEVPWVRKILAGEKSWEVRSKPNARSGRIALCEKGGPIVATATIRRSVTIPPGKSASHFARHRVTTEDLRAFYGDRPVHAWQLSDVPRIDPPIPYSHPRAARGSS